MGRFRRFLYVSIAVAVCSCFAAAQAAPGPGVSPESAVARQPVLTGTITYLQRIALPQDASIEVKIQDVTPGSRPRTIAETVFAPAGKQVPIPFQLAYNPADINQAHTYQAAATISVNGKPMFTSLTTYPVITLGAPSRLAMVLQPAPTQPASAASSKLIGTRWVLLEVSSKTAQPGQGESVHLELHKKGKLTGSTGCNRLSGSYIASQGAVQFTPAAMTMKACSDPVMQQEQAVLGALKSTTDYHIEGQTLELRNGEQVLAKFEAEAK